jgi:hypothetical protein
MQKCKMKGRPQDIMDKGVLSEPSFISASVRMSKRIKR